MRQMLPLLGIAALTALLSCSVPPRLYKGIDRTFMSNITRIAVMPFGPYNQAAQTQGGQTQGGQQGGQQGAVTGTTGAGAGGTGATGPATNAATLTNTVNALSNLLMGQGQGGSSTPDAQLLTAAVESELVGIGANNFDVIEREQFMLLLREKQMNDTEFKDQSVMNLMELGEKVGVDAYLTGAIDDFRYIPELETWELVARMKVIDTRAAKVWYNEIFVAHGRDRTQTVRRWSRLVGKALTQEDFEVAFVY